MVAQGAKIAQPARDVLARAGVKIHDAVNGTVMKIAKHHEIHSGDYYKKVNSLLENAEKAAKGDLNQLKKNVENALNKLRKELEK